MQTADTSAIYADIPAESTKTVYDDDVQFSRLVYNVHMRRKAMYYIINFVVPCCIFSILAVVTFLLSPTCGERIGLGQFSFTLYSNKSIVAYIVLCPPLAAKIESINVRHF